VGSVKFLESSCVLKKVWLDINPETNGKVLISISVQEPCPKTTKYNHENAQNLVFGLSLSRGN
jgi:hypothetical protein